MSFSVYHEFHPVLKAHCNMNNEVLREYMNSNNNDVRYVLLIMLSDGSDLSHTVPYCTVLYCTMLAQDQIQQQTADLH
jgi:hypothetical protein